MSNPYEGEKCPVCHSYLFEEDDVVVCPVCGAPHHRRCWQSLGHCGLEDLHGTDRQYDVVKRREAQSGENPAEGSAGKRAAEGTRCPRCGRELDGNMLFCPNCGAPRGEAEDPGGRPGYVPYMNGIDPLGGVPPKTDLGEGVTAREAADFIKSNTVRYIPKFAQNAKTSWNWLAFLLPPGFFFYRKMYRHAWVAAAVYLTAKILQLPRQAEYAQILSNLPIGGSGNPFSAVEGMSISLPARLMYYGGTLLLLALGIVCGLFADRWYRNHVIARVREYRSLSGDEREAVYIKKGLPNPFFLLLSVLALMWLPVLLLPFLT